MDKLKLRPIAVGTGAFLFAFGLPVLAQEGHVQLVYRFCVPLACYFLLRYFKKPQLKTLVVLFAFLVWQFYISIYLGLFLFLLLVVLAVLFRLTMPDETVWFKFTLAPKNRITAWGRASKPGKVLFLIAIALLGLALVLLFLPYIQVTRAYGFVRIREEVAILLPRIQSYFLADNSLIWKGASSLIQGIRIRHEHQLFPGLAASLLVLIGLIFGRRFQNRGVAFVYLGAALLLAALTLFISGYSLYYFLLKLPGVSSIRAVSRIILVILWPVSVFAAWVVNAILQKKKVVWQVFLLLVILLLVAESVFYQHAAYNKADAQARIADLRGKLPTDLPDDPVLYVAWDGEGYFWETEIDAMLLAQELGWPTFNGYSGNFPPGYASPRSCEQLPARILTFMKLNGISDPSYYLDLMNRAVLVGFTDCDPAWWVTVPNGLP